VVAAFEKAVRERDKSIPHVLAPPLPSPVASIHAQLSTARASDGRWSAHGRAAWARRMCHRLSQAPGRESGAGLPAQARDKPAERRNKHHRRPSMRGRPRQVRLVGRQVRLAARHPARRRAGLHSDSKHGARTQGDTGPTPVVRDVTNETNEAGAKGDATCADRHGASGLRCLPARAALRRVACRRLRRLRGGYYAAVWGGMFVRAFGETAPCRGAGARVRSHG